MLIQILRRTRLAVNTADISAIFIFTENHQPVLEVQMRSGRKYQIHHEPTTALGDDVYQVHKRLLEAK
ncbi:hypothetical protein NTD89_28145 [Pseudomonas sp. 14P_5.3_Bac1]|uniref:hypothetical protein n=1 Tax=Pseudomonas sp. 14P_5.3_Bac1 TaxID=2971622 RepID=UPI0021C62FD1|nr:hypothetical protein [Pseudomonas sp. 14P_5.3_Bac1]MCU1780882.1 hypothetical protein [Pseudomonas sp. 14P_5.3_Bac1]